MVVNVKTPEEWRKVATGIQPYYESAMNVCKLLRDAWLILEDGPDDSDSHRAEEKIGEAMTIARQILKDLAQHSS